MSLVLPYRGILTPTARCAVRITDGGLASLRPGHDAAAALREIESREPREAPDPPPWDDDGPAHLALVPVGRPADIPAALGWFGPFDDVADLCAVLRWREDRLGEYLVRLGRTSMGFGGGQA